MAVRYLANAGRLIMSKAGFDAGPALADENKLFDSNWMATGLVIATGTIFKPSASPISIPFPYPLHYAPAADAYLVSDGGGNANDRGGAFVAGYTTQNELVITEGWSGRSIRYIIWAVSI